MDIQAYISSGILELYVSGKLPEEEAIEVTKMVEQHPEVRAEVELIEQNLMSMFIQSAGDGPTEDVLAKAMAEIEKEDGDAIVMPIMEDLKIPRDDDTASQDQGRKLWIRTLAVAASLALLISLAFNLYFYTQWQETGKQLNKWMADNQILAENMQGLQTDFEASKEMLAQITDANTQRVSLEGTEQHPLAEATVYWNQQENTIHLYTKNLPDLEAGSIYQLWALVDGKPVDAGIFSPSDSIQLMKTLAVNAGAFAVTLEPEGGSVNPSLDKMYVLGETTKAAG